MIIDFSSKSGSSEASNQLSMLLTFPDASIGTIVDYKGALYRNGAGGWENIAGEVLADGITLSADASSVSKDGGTVNLSIVYIGEEVNKYDVTLSSDNEGVSFSDISWKGCLGTATATFGASSSSSSVDINITATSEYGSSTVTVSQEGTAVGIVSAAYDSSDDVPATGGSLTLTIVTDLDDKSGIYVSGSSSAMQGVTVGDINWEGNTGTCSISVEANSYTSRKSHSIRVYSPVNNVSARFYQSAAAEHITEFTADTTSVEQTGGTVNLIVVSDVDDKENITLAADTEGVVTFSDITWEGNAGSATATFANNDGSSRDITITASYGSESKSISVNQSGTANYRTVDFHIKNIFDYMVANSVHEIWATFGDPCNQQFMLSDEESSEYSKFRTIWGGWQELPFSTISTEWTEASYNGHTCWYKMSEDGNDYFYKAEITDIDPSGWFSSDPSSYYEEITE